MSDKFLKMVVYANSLICIKSTGTPKQMAKRLGISERSWFLLRDILISYGAPIRWSRNRKSYFYEYDGNFVVRFILNSNEAAM